MNHLIFRLFTVAVLIVTGLASPVRADYVMLVRDSLAANETWYRVDNAGQVINSLSIPPNDGLFPNLTLSALDPTTNDVYTLSTGSNFIKISPDGTLATVSSGSFPLINARQLWVENGVAVVLRDGPGSQQSLTSYNFTSGNSQLLAQLPTDNTGLLSLYDQTRRKFYYAGGSIPYTQNTPVTLKVFDIVTNTTTSLVPGLQQSMIPNGQSTLTGVAIEPFTGSVVAHLPTFPVANFSVGALLYDGSVNSYSPLLVASLPSTPYQLSYNPTGALNGAPNATISGLRYVGIGLSTTLNKVIYDIDLIGAILGNPGYLNVVHLSGAQFNGTYKDILFTAAVN